jgi:hypothetical protein
LLATVLIFLDFNQMGRATLTQTVVSYSIHLEISDVGFVAMDVLPIPKHQGQEIFKSI